MVSASARLADLGTGSHKAVVFCFGGIMQMHAIIDPVGLAERHWGISLKRASREEYYSLSGCPFCGDGGKGEKSNRFRIFLDGSPRYWCRRCGQQGFLDTLEKQDPLTSEEKRLRQIEAEQRRQARKQAEMEYRLTALEQMHKCKDHVAYHQALDEQTLEYWWMEGMTSETIDRYMLGYCASCPTYRESPSYTIPIINRGELENIRHRLIAPNGTGKYRPHRAGLGLSLFNVDLLDQADKRILLVEGEKKSIVTAQSGFLNVGITGKRSFRSEWLDWFTHVSKVYIVLDPDATASAYRLATLFGECGRVVEMPVKIDDAIVKYGASSFDIENFLRLARRAR